MTLKQHLIFKNQTIISVKKLNVILNNFFLFSPIIGRLCHDKFTAWSADGFSYMIGRLCNPCHQPPRLAVCAKLVTWLQDRPIMSTRSADCVHLPFVSSHIPPSSYTHKSLSINTADKPSTDTHTLAHLCAALINTDGGVKQPGVGSAAGISNIRSQQHDVISQRSEKRSTNFTKI